MNCEAGERLTFTTEDYSYIWSVYNSWKLFFISFLQVRGTVVLAEAMTVILRSNIVTKLLFRYNCIYRHLQFIK